MTLPLYDEDNIVHLGALFAAMNREREHSLTAHDCFLAEKTEEAIHDGRQLRDWVYDRNAPRVRHPLELKQTFQLPYRAEAFFGEAEINGCVRPLMGCHQEIEFGKIEGPQGPELLKDFVFAEFLRRAHWTNPDRSAGGFTVRQSLYRTREGEHGRFSPEGQNGCVDWRLMGDLYSWVLLTIEIHDFVMEFGPVRKRFREAACVAPNPYFMRVTEDSEGPNTLEIFIGYPFVEYAPIANVFGFGPGKFGTAVKLFSFLIDRNRRIWVRMDFAATPRCQKVFDFGKRWPDPVYGGARVVSRLTRGHWNAEAFHDKVDRQMLAQHCRVHQSLIDGVQPIWQQWVQERRSAR